MKKKVTMFVIFLSFFFLVGCGKNDKNMNDLIDNVMEYNNNESNKGFSWYRESKENTNFYVWENANNYFVILKWNNDIDGSKSSDYVAYRVNKEDGNVTDDKKKQGVSMDKDNQKPVYKLENVSLYGDGYGTLFEK